jgi:hypothetical protein
MLFDSDQDAGELSNLIERERQCRGAARTPFLADTAPHHLPVMLADDELVGIDLAAHQRLAETPRRVDHQLVIGAGHWIHREGHTSGDGLNHALNQHPHLSRIGRDTLRAAVFQRPRGACRRPTRSDSLPEISTTHTDHRLVDSSERLSAAVFADTGRANCEGRVGWQPVKPRMIGERRQVFVGCGPHHDESIRDPEPGLLQTRAVVCLGTRARFVSRRQFVKCSDVSVDSSCHSRNPF